MTRCIDFEPGGYTFLRGGFPYSQGVVAREDHAIERARFRRPVPVMEGFARIEAHLKALGRPLTALCAAELRSPQPFTMAGFGEFNGRYVDVLKRWGIYRDDLNPVARSNVAPQVAPPQEPCFYAFSYTVARPGAARGFVIAGSGEWPEGGRFPDDIVARGDVSPAGLRAKARAVMDTMQRRLGELGLTWDDVTDKQVYCVHDIHALFAEEILARAGNAGGTCWHLCRPPIIELEYEMDVRGVAVEHVI